MVQYGLLGTIGAVALLLVALRKFLKQSNDECKEPPIVRSTIPLIGHILGMIRYKVFYYQMLRDQTSAPIFSVPVIGKSIYVITSPQLVSTVQRMTKTLAFEPIVAMATQRVSGCSPQGNSIIQYNIDGSQGDRGYVITFFKTMHPALAPGPSLDAMNRIMIQNIAKSADALATSPVNRLNLCKWLRHELTIATTYSVYGPANPMADAKVEDAFWEFEGGLMMLLVNVLPSITARRASEARIAVGKAFQRYFEKGEHLNGSALVQARYNHSREYGLSMEDIGTFEAGGCLATLANTFPTAYWMLAYIYSHPDVLQECRNEVATITTTKPGEDGGRLHVIDMTTIKASCPVITATLQEVLRHTSVGSTVREVVEDTTLDVYALKKGNTLLTPANVLHTDSSLWGANTDTFDHRRFLRAPGKKMPSPTAFRAFGGGSTLCPGRHFATTEVLAIATVFIARFDMLPVGSWPPPDRGNAQFWTQILGPNLDFEVEIHERKELKGVKDKWAFQLSESKVVFAMAAEDLNEVGKE
ncbi:putative cytochrome P450 [Pleomassaria siparia CBS 279.74]|uniref:Putative cytochrome P450 n=1 Tax=Pleomassaria siparia CBS 279.74 TaxID=1314801 RepID=A0A6G1K7Y8_9PLEO|nr:putative cytochrome P450 [Pleomassaria siparia CBS 279.74]